MSACLITRPQNRGRMHRRHHTLRIGRLQNLPSRSHQGKRSTQQRFRCRSSKTHHHLRLHCVQLRQQPRPASIDLAHPRTLMQPSLAPQHKLEVLHRVCHKNRFGIDLNFFYDLPKHHSGRTHERLTRQIFLVSRLFTHQHQPRTRCPSAWNYLRRMPVKVTTFATRHRVAEGRKRVLVRYEWCRSGELCQRRSHGLRLDAPTETEVLNAPEAYLDTGEYHPLRDTARHNPCRNQ